MSTRLFSLACLLLSGTVWANPDNPVPANDHVKMNAAPLKTEKDAKTPIRLAAPLTLSYDSNWFLLSGLRVSYRVRDPRTELGLTVGSAVTTGCGPQAPACETERSVSLGARRYLSTGRFTAYAGTKLHYLHGGIRFRQGRTAMADVNGGLHWQFWNGYTMGFGYTYFLFDGEESGFDLGQQGWMHTEFGKSF